MLYVHTGSGTIKPWGEPDRPDAEASTAGLADSSLGAGTLEQPVRPVESMCARLRVRGLRRFLTPSPVRAQCRLSLKRLRSVIFASTGDGYAAGT